MPRAKTASGRRRSGVFIKTINPRELVEGLAFDFLDEWTSRKVPTSRFADREDRERIDERREDLATLAYQAVFDRLAGLIVSGEKIDRMALRNHEGGGSGIDPKLYHRLSVAAEDAVHSRRTLAADAAIRRG